MKGAMLQRSHVDLGVPRHSYGVIVSDCLRSHGACIDRVVTARTVLSRRSRPVVLHCHWYLHQFSILLFAQGNNGRLWRGSNSRLTDYELYAPTTSSRRPLSNSFNTMPAKWVGNVKKEGKDEWLHSGSAGLVYRQAVAPTVVAQQTW